MPPERDGHLPAALSQVFRHVVAFQRELDVRADEAFLVADVAAFALELQSIHGPAPREASQRFRKLDLAVAAGDGLPDMFEDVRRQQVPTGNRHIGGCLLRPGLFHDVPDPVNAGLHRINDGIAEQNDERLLMDMMRGASTQHRKPVRSSPVNRTTYLLLMPILLQESRNILHLKENRQNPLTYTTKSDRLQGKSRRCSAEGGWPRVER